MSFPINSVRRKSTHLSFRSVHKIHVYYRVPTMQGVNILVVFLIDCKCNYCSIDPFTFVSWFTRCGSSVFRTSTSGQTSIKRATEASSLPYYLVANYRLWWRQVAQQGKTFVGNHADNLLAFMPLNSYEQDQWGNPYLSMWLTNHDLYLSLVCKSPQFVQKL